MPKNLVIVAHPQISNSTINKRWVEELEQYPSDITVRNIYDIYPSGQIDVDAEQRLLEEHVNIVFQFPMQWFSCPSLLKLWFDEVFTHGWAFGSCGDKLNNKNFIVAVSTGQPAAEYTAEGRCAASITDILTPFKVLANFVGADFKEPFIFHSPHSDPTTPYTEAALLEVDRSAKKYLDMLNSM